MAKSCKLAGLHSANIRQLLACSWTFNPWVAGAAGATNRQCCTHASPSSAVGPAISRHTPGSVLPALGKHAVHHHHHVYLLPGVNPTTLVPAAAARSTPRSLLPFIGGAAFGALGLAAWQQVHADSPSPQLALRSGHSSAAVQVDQFTAGCSGTPALSHDWYNSPSPTQPSTSTVWQDADGITRSPWQAVSWGWGGWGASKDRGDALTGALARAGPTARPTAGHSLPPESSSSWRTTSATRCHVIAPVDRPPLVPCSVPAATASSGAASQPAASTSSQADTGESSSHQQPLTRGAISAASAAAAPAVVHIVVADDVNPHSAPGTSLASQLARFRSSSGSGFVYDARGYILTNAHVVSAAVPPSPDTSAHLNGTVASGPVTAGGMGLGHTAQLQWSSSGGAGAGAAAAAGAAPTASPVLSITMHDGRVLKGRVVAWDSVSDVAVVKAELGPGESLPVCAVGKSSKLRVGEWVVALGTPLMLKQSVTAGIVSCVERRASELGLQGPLCGYIQTDASINQGNSGGPLVDLDGRVVGMSVFKAIAADGVSFALPVDTVCEVVRHFAEYGRVVRPYVGVTMVEVTNGALKELQAAIPQLAGARAAVMLQAVKEGSPAQVAGFSAEDILVSLEGHSVVTMSEVVDLFARGVGKPMAVGVIRRSGVGPDVRHTTLTLHVTPQEAP